LGELRGEEALSFLRAVNTGVSIRWAPHSGGSFFLAGDFPVPR
jgi:Flp pilus assembly CpaF family ATPase